MHINVPEYFIVFIRCYSIFNLLYALNYWACFIPCGCLVLWITQPYATCVCRFSKGAQFFLHRDRMNPLFQREVNVKWTDNGQRESGGRVLKPQPSNCVHCIDTVSLFLCSSADFLEPLPNKSDSVEMLPDVLTMPWHIEPMCDSECFLKRRVFNFCQK